MFGTNKERASYKLKQGLEEVSREKAATATKRELFNNALNSESKYQRYLNFLRLIKSFLPEEANASENVIRRLLYTTSHLPFDPRKFKFHETNLGNGGQVRVYLLESQTDEPSLALKIFTPQKKYSHSDSQAAQLKKEKNEIANLYSEVENLIPDEHYIVLGDPFMNNLPATAVIEEFISGEMFDIFSFTEKELSDLAKKNPLFREQLIKFVQITLQNESANGEVIDIVGPKNLIAVKKKDDSFHLILIDPHGDFNTNKDRDINAPKAKEKLDFLRKVLPLIEI